MRLPHKNASVPTRLNYARYLGQRLRRSKLTTDENDVKTLSDAMRQADLAETALEEELTSLYADRDAADDELDDLTKRHRQAIEGRATNANRERPYTDIFPDGVAWYTASPLNEQVNRYELLVRRYNEFLPDGDPVRAEATRITQGVAAWKDSTDKLAKAELDLAMARGKTAQTVSAWEEGLRRLYFRLAERVGKTQAERFFPKASRGSRVDDDLDADSPVNPGTPPAP